MKLVNRKEISYTGDTYNLHVKKNHNYIVDGAVVSNCHHFQAKSLIKIMKMLHNCPRRLGTTGTLSGIEVDKLVIEGLFGKIERISRTSTLIKQGHSAAIDMYTIRGDYRGNPRIKFYWDEVKFMEQHQGRNEFIVNLAKSLTGNTVIMFKHIEHGKRIHEMLEAENEDKNIYLVHGTTKDKGITKAETREKVRQAIEKDEERKSILLASNIFSTGINIVNIDNIIFTFSTKSFILLLQSIGRGVRKSEIKKKVRVFDIMDNLKYARNHANVRRRIYEDEDIPYTVKKVVFKND